MKASEIRHGMRIRWGAADWTVMRTIHGISGVTLDVARWDGSERPEGSIGPLGADTRIEALADRQIVWPIEYRRPTPAGGAHDVVQVMAWAASETFAGDIIRSLGRSDLWLGLSVAIERPPQ